MRNEKNYRMKDLGTAALIGRQVLSAKINDEKDLVILQTTTGPLYLTWEGDCCAHCYLAQVSGVENLIEGTVLKVEDAEWTSLKEDDYETIESMGTNIQTDKGYITFESRVEHNGYYGGRIQVSDDEPMDQYSSPRYDTDELASLKLKSLEDFNAY